MIESNNNAKISGTSTEVNQVKTEEAKETEEPKKIKEKFKKDPITTVITPIEPTRDIEKPLQKFKEEEQRKKEEVLICDPTRT